MMYRITLNGSDIYGPTSEQAVIDPHLDIELNSAGTLEFTLPVENDLWGVPQVFQDDVEVYEDGKVIFFGRPLQITRDWNNQKKVVCEGALAFFNDSIQRTNEIKLSQHKTLEWFFRDLISKHNAQVDDFPTIGSISPKHFEVGTIDIPNKEKYVYRKTDYQTTLECLQQMCLDTDGGYFITRREYDDYGNYTNYIDWVETMPVYSDQPVQFGVNLLDITQDINGADICTVLMPLGNENCTLSNYRSWDPYAGGNMYQGVGHVAHSDEIYYQPGLELYGRVVQHKTWNDYSEGNENGLWMKAAEWLKKKNEYIPTIEVDAADLHYIDKYKIDGEPIYGVFMLGMEVQVISAPHGLTELNPDEEHPTLIIHKLSLELDSGVKKITIGTPPKKELTDILAPSSTSGSKRKSGGEGDGAAEYSVTELVPVTDVMVKASGETEYSSTRSNGKIYLDMDSIAAGKVKDVQVDGVSVVDEETGVAEIESAVSDVLVDGTSVVNEDHEAEITIPVKGVTYNGINVVNPNTGIAEIEESLNIGNIEDVDWYERGYAQTDPEVRTVTVTEPGIYCAVFSLLDDQRTARHDSCPEILPHYLDLSVSGGTVLFQKYLDKDESYSGYEDYKNGKIIIFSNSGTSVVTFRGTNYSFSLITNAQVGVERPASNGWYEYDSTLKYYVLSEDTVAVQGKTYFDKISSDGTNGYILLSNVQVGVDRPYLSGWYEHSSDLHRLILSQDDYAIEYKNYYEKSTDFSKSVSWKIRHVFKISNIDVNYLSFIKQSMITEDVIDGRLFLDRMVPNDNNVYMIIATSGCNTIYGGARIRDVNGDAYFDSVSDYQGINLDTIFTPNTISTNKSLIHIGDGTYNEPAYYPSGSTEVRYNSSNICLTLSMDSWRPYENVSYIVIDTGANIHANTNNPSIDGSPAINAVSFRLSQPIGVLDVQHNGQSITDINGIAEIGDVAYKEDVTNVQTTLQANFQAGVDSVYDACVSKGSTPASHSLTDVVDGILAIPTGGGGGGVTVTSSAKELYVPRGSAHSDINAVVTVTTTAKEGE